jgi:hypothetical protein
LFTIVYSNNNLTENYHGSLIACLIVTPHNEPSEGGELRFSQKMKFLAKFILMVGTFRYVFSHVKYKISSKIPPERSLFFRYRLFSCDFTSDWTGD